MEPLLAFWVNFFTLKELSEGVESGRGARPQPFSWGGGGRKERNTDLSWKKDRSNRISLERHPTSPAWAILWNQEPQVRMYCNGVLLIAVARHRCFTSWRWLGSHWVTGRRQVENIDAKSTGRRESGPPPKYQPLKTPYRLGHVSRTFTYNYISPLNLYPDLFDKAKPIGVGLSRWRTI